MEGFGGIGFGFFFLVCFLVGFLFVLFGNTMVMKLTWDSTVDIRIAQITRNTSYDLGD